MGGKMSKNKGANGERELAKLLASCLGIENINRNLAQSREGGADILDIEGLAIEVKRQENLCLPAWWKQTVKQAVDTKRLPVLAYRQNRREWKFCLPAYNTRVCNIYVSRP